MRSTTTASVYQMALAFLMLLVPSVTLCEPGWSGDLIIRYKKPLSVPHTKAKALDRHGILYRVPGKHISAYTNKNKGRNVQPLTTYEDDCAAYLSSNVESCEPDRLIEAEVVPIDPDFPKLINLIQIRAPQAWDYSTDSNVAVAVLDSGIEIHHPDLSANIWVNPGEIADDGSDNDNNGYIDDTHGYDFFNDDSLALDDHGHGTHVAGTIGAVGNNGIGISGVAWRVKILPLKILGANGSGPLSSALKALDYLLELKQRYGLRIVVNASWGGHFSSPALETAISESSAAGIIFVASAGNSSSNDDLLPHMPSGAKAANVISVGSVDQYGGRAAYSNYGVHSVDLGAPGTSIFSTLPGSSYGTLSGTSMSTAHVSGAAALIWSRYPSASHLGVKETILKNVTSTDLPFASGGSLDLLAAISGEGYAPALLAPRITRIRDSSSGGLNRVFPGRLFSIRMRGKLQLVSLYASMYGNDCPKPLGFFVLDGTKGVRMRLPNLPVGKAVFTITDSIGSSDSRAVRIRANKIAARQKSKFTRSGEALNISCERLRASLK